MAGDDELTLLGSGPLPAQRKLECFEIAPTVTRIELVSDELVSRCPVTGQTDIYRAAISYRPAGRALETKSLKLYLASYREGVGHFAERLADLIAGDVANATAAAEVEVTLTQNRRGGIDTTVTAVRPG